jgi:hypothetical protein
MILPAHVGAKAACTDLDLVTFSITYTASLLASLLEKRIGLMLLELIQLIASQLNGYPLVI